MTEVTYQWVECQMNHLPPSQRKKIPKWAWRAVLSSGGVVFIPSLLVGSEMEVFLCAGYDGVDALLDEGHLYYPADWVAREFPQFAEFVRRLERKVRTTVSGDRPAEAAIET